METLPKSILSCVFAGPLAAIGMMLFAPPVPSPTLAALAPQQQVLCRDYFIANCLDCPGESSYHCRLSANGPFQTCTEAAPTSPCEEGHCDQIDLGPTGCS